LIRFILEIILILVVWYFLTRYIFPKLGIPT
jgi:hypothetical protein